MNPLWLFATLGGVFGALMLLALLVSLALCVRASLRSSNPRRRRIAAICSSLPVIAGALTVVGGLVFCQIENVEVQWWALGRAFLAGVVVALLPLAWSLLLLRKPSVAASA